MKIRFLHVASQELLEASAWLEGDNEGMAAQFTQEVAASVLCIRDFPRAFRLVSKRTRCCLVPRFQYLILYQVRTDEILITGIMHTARDPQSWKHRL